MQVRFLLGPAGSGKTWRCLEEIRAALRGSPEGRPLIFLAPKQATFQLERQLLAEAGLRGYGRLHILSFERLAGFVFDHLSAPRPRLLNEEGRVMVLRALLTRHREDLHVFRGSARLPGFAQQLSQVLRELQQHRAGPGRLEMLAAKVGGVNRLNEKLLDLALLLHKYLGWLKQHQVDDGDGLLDLAAAALRRPPAPVFPSTECASEKSVRTDLPVGSKTIQIEALWLDGFAQMTPQERHFLSALLPHCQRATLAFCLESEPTSAPPWYSPWTILAQTYRQCRLDTAELAQDLQGRETGSEPEVVLLPRRPDRGRFASCAALQHLEQHWSAPEPYSGPPESVPPIRVLECAQPEAETTAAAREILRFVRGGGRFRDVAVLVRQLEIYHDSVRRVFSRYGIPYFLDRRERVAHHPLAELTRSSLRTVAFHWRHDDWFAALKSGLIRVSEAEVDWLENQALERGWEGPVWHRDFHIPDHPTMAHALNRVRARLVGPFQELAKRVGTHPSGVVLAGALHRFWDVLRVGHTLEAWSHPDPALDTRADAIEAGRRTVHGTVWEQMHHWLDNLALAFPEETMPLPEWLPILSSGLDGLTVGIIPPVLDHVLVGAIDRSRNPDLKRAILLGINETVFPAAPTAPVLLTESDRQRLDEVGHPLGTAARSQLGHERFYGYIACTRAREQVLLTYARSDANGRALNPSSFLSHLRRLFPWLEPETDVRPELPEPIAPEERSVHPGIRHWADAEHPAELVGPLLVNRARPLDQRDPELAQLESLPPFAALLERLSHLRPASRETVLPPHRVRALYGDVLHTSISRIEKFAHCPFRFFVESGLRVEERKRFELDLRQQGSFQHEVLARFHQELRRENLRWRDLTSAEASARIGRVADALIPEFENGLLAARGRHRIMAENYKHALQQFIGVVIDWFGQYELDPVEVELGFGRDSDPLPGWELELEGGRKMVLRGRIDRVDLWVDSKHDRALCVVVDYKSGRPRPERVLLAQGLQQQLPAYLNVLRHLPNPRVHFGVSTLIPAGVFYVSLRGAFTAGKTRADVLDHPEEALRKAYQHQGLFDLAYRSLLDNRPGAQSGDQFPYRLKKNGSPDARTFCSLETSAFQAILDRQQQQLLQIGNGLYQGDVRIDPWQHGNQTACEDCEFQAICRIDPWTHAFRALERVPKRNIEQ